MLTNIFKKVFKIFKIIFYLIYILFILIVLKYRFWYTKKVFEKELLKQGLSKSTIKYMVNIFNREWNIFTYIRQVFLK